MLLFSFLVGQCTLAALLALPSYETNYLLLLPALVMQRRWSLLAFACGCLWQIAWLSPEQRFCHSYLWFLCSGSSEADLVPLFFEHGILQEIAQSLSQRLSDFYLAWDPSWGAWFLKFAFGYKGAAGDNWAAIYQDLGLLHILVVSGSHFSFLGMLCQLVFEGPFRIAYALKILNFSTWLGCVTMARLTATVVITVFALVVGFNPPCQRSWLALLLGLWLPLAGAPLSERQRDRWVCSLQALCFPNTFLSVSNALSWSAYAMVRYLSPWPKVWQRIVLPSVEGPMVAVSVSYFGSFSPWGLVINTLLQPVWHIILFSGLCYWLWPEPWLGAVLLHALEMLHNGILFVHGSWQFDGPLYFSNLETAGRWWRAGLWCIGSWKFFSIWSQREEAC